VSTSLSQTRSASGTESQLSTLIEVSRVFTRAISADEACAKALEILQHRLGVIRAGIFLLDSESKAIRVQVANAEWTEYALGRESAARAIETGSPVVASDDTTSESDHGQISHISLPFCVNGQSVGALGVDLHLQTGRSYVSEVECLSLVAGMIAQAIKAERAADGERRRFAKENPDLDNEQVALYEFTNIIGSTSAMRQVLLQIEQVAQTNTTVLLSGESGTGKELIARAIHHRSPRAKARFVKVNCGALPDSLIESELFGYEKGAFTGAHSLKKGRFDLAEGGTLFIDEIADMNLAAQTKLLRVLQEKEFDRLGGTMTISANVRLIAVTSRDLEKAIAGGKFREDLYYRLNVFAIKLPALRDRKADLPLLTNHFLRKYAREHKKEVRRISSPAMDMLSAYHWPGNVRELENVIERAVLVCDSNVLNGHHLPPTLQATQVSDAVMTMSLADAMASYEKEILCDALKTARGNRTAAASLLQTTERIINYRIRRYQIDVNRFRS
jgi:Nif-specific regulatory protein